MSEEVIKVKKVDVISVTENKAAAKELSVTKSIYS
jgi:hypothetical protein